jgi:hypothetical protein
MKFIFVIVALLSLKTEATVLPTLFKGLRIQNIVDMHPFLSDLTFKDLQASKKDLVLIMHGGSKLYAHSSVLVAFSAYPRFNPESPTYKPKVDLSDINTSTMLIILTFLYTGEMKPKDADLAEIGKTLDFLTIDPQIISHYWYRVVKTYCDWIEDRRCSFAKANEYFNALQVPERMHSLWEINETRTEYSTRATAQCKML